MRHRLILAGVLLALAGCAGSDPQAPAKAALLGCESVAAQLNILLPLRRDGKLPETAVAVIDRQRDITDPICLGPAPDVNATWGEVAVDGAARTLAAIAAEYE